MFNQAKSFEVATKVVAKIKKQFNVAVDASTTRQGTVIVVVNNNYFADESNSSNPNVLTPENLSKVINDDFYSVRNSGNYFSQPVMGQFEIGIQ